MPKKANYKCTCDPPVLLAMWVAQHCITLMPLHYKFHVGAHSVIILAQTQDNGGNISCVGCVARCPSIAPCSPARRHDIPMALSHRSLVAPGAPGLYNSTQKASWIPKKPLLKPPSLWESAPRLTFQWKPLSPRFSPDISRILTLRMHERRISQRNTDAANSTRRPPGCHNHGLERATRQAAGGG